MSYKPQSQKQSTNGPRVGGNGKPVLYPVPEAGNQAARISLIVDLGTQERDDFVDQKTKIATPQSPCQQLVIFADLVDQVVDYGGDIGKAQYRLLLNHTDKGKIQGVNFNAVPARDAEGNTVKGKMWTFHPQNMLTKLAKATGQEQILGKDEDNNMDISQLLGQGFYADVSVTQTEDRNGKKDNEGNTVVYTNVNFKGASKPPIIKGKPAEIEDLQVTPMILNHENVTKETLVYIRGKVLEMMKKAPEYHGKPPEFAGSALKHLLGDTGNATSSTKDDGSTGVAGSGNNASNQQPDDQDDPALQEQDSTYIDPDAFDDDIPF
jgi:hypothetical protein